MSSTSPSVRSSARAFHQFADLTDGRDNIAARGACFLAEFGRAGELEHLRQLCLDAAQRELDGIADRNLVDATDHVALLGVADVVVVRLVFEAIEAQVFDAIVSTTDVQRRSVVVELDVCLGDLLVAIGVGQNRVGQLARFDDKAHRAGIDVRMITGDHAVTAGAIGSELGLPTGAVSGADLKAMSDEELSRRLPDLHVFGRVTPDDKLRLVGLLQAKGAIVAMTGDAVNDAAAIKQANIGVAMGSGSEVTKQAAKLVLTDDNFATLVHAVELGRIVYSKITAYLRFQMTQLLSLIMLFLAASAFSIAEGVALFPAQVLFINFFVALFAVLAIAADANPPGIMNHPPRDPRIGVVNPVSLIEWLVYGTVIFLIALVPLLWGPDEPSPTEPRPVLACELASALSWELAQLKPAPMLDDGLDENTSAGAVPQSISPSGPMANTCSWSLPFASVMLMRAMLLVSGLELIQ